MLWLLDLVGCSSTPSPTLVLSELDNPFSPLTTYDSVCPISAHREKPPQALLIRCFLVSRDSASVPDLAYLTTLYTCSQRSHDRNLGHHLPWDPSAPLTLHTGIPCRK